MACLRAATIRNVPAYVAVAAHRRAITLWKRNQREVEIPEGKEFATHSRFSLTAIDVKRAVGTLTPREQELIRLTYWEGMTADEIVEMLRDRGGDTTAPAIHTALSRARKKVEIQLAGYR